MGSWGRYGRFRPWLILVALASVFMGVRAAQAQTSRLALDDYWRVISEILDSLNNADADDNAAREVAADRLAAIVEIEMADGRIQSIDHSFLISQLQNENISLETITTLFTAYLSSRQGWPDPSLPLLDEAALTNILSQPEFNYTPEEPNFFQRLWQDIRQAIKDFFLRLVPEDSAFRAPLGNLILIVASLLVAVVLAYALRGLIGDFSADAAMSAEEELGGEPLTANLAMQRAQELSTGGDYRTAVRYLYLSSLLLLEERGLLRYDRSLTNREYLRSVAHRPELASVLRDVIDVFDRVWYGFQMVDAREYEQYAQQVETLRQQKEAR